MMTYEVERTRLLQRAGRTQAEELLPAPFKLWFGSHDTGCQMTIVCKQDGHTFTVWSGSIWYHDRYEFNDRDKIKGLNPEFEFARAVIDAYFADIQNAVNAYDKKRAEDSAAAELRNISGKHSALAKIKAQVSL
jgi:hypothetical protein